MKFTGEPSPSPSPWPDLVARMQHGDTTAMEDLYDVFSNGIRLHLARRLGGTDLNDNVHDLFVAVAESICNGEIRQPERLMGYVRTVVRRHVASYIEQRLRERRNTALVDLRSPISDCGPNPERWTIDRQVIQLTMRVLSGMRERERQVLIRFYLRDQTPQEICRAMNLTETQYRILKSRAKARLGDLCRKRLEGRTRLRLQ